MTFGQTTVTTCSWMANGKKSKPTGIVGETTAAKAIIGKNFNGYTTKCAYGDVRFLLPK